MAVIAVASTAVSAVGKITNVLGKITGISNLFGQSSGFQQRERDSKWFFTTRDQIAAMKPNMTATQLARWNALSFHRVDYNTRRENAAERAELQSYIDWFNADIASASFGKGGGNFLTGSVGGIPIWLIVLSGVVALVYVMRKGGQ